MSYHRSYGPSGGGYNPNNYLGGPSPDHLSPSRRSPPSCHYHTPYPSNLPQSTSYPRSFAAPTSTKIWLQMEFGEPHLAEELTVDPLWTISRLKQEVATAGLFKAIQQPSDIDCILFQELKVKTSVTISELPQIQTTLFYIRPAPLPPMLAPFPMYAAQPLRRARSPGDRGGHRNKKRMLNNSGTQYGSMPFENVIHAPFMGAYPPVFNPGLVLPPKILAVGVKATSAEIQAVKNLQGLPNYVGENTHGVDKQAETLAELFYTRLRERCHGITKRGALSALFLVSLPSWAPPEVVQDIKQQRPFKQILHALSRGMEVCEVMEKGKVLKWPNLHSAKSLKYLEHNVDVTDAKTDYSAGGFVLSCFGPTWGSLQGSSASRTAWDRRPLYFEVRVQKGLLVRLGFVRLGSDPITESLAFESSGLKCEEELCHDYGKNFIEKDTVGALLYYYDPGARNDYELFANAAPDNILPPGQPPAKIKGTACKYFLAGKCTKGEMCPYKHVVSSQASSSTSSAPPSEAEFCRIEFSINGVSQGVAFTVPASELLVPFVAVQQAQVQVVFDQGPLEFRPSCVPMPTAEFYDNAPKPQTVVGNVCTFWLKGDSGCNRADCKFLHQVPTESDD